MKLEEMFLVFAGFVFLVALAFFLFTTRQEQIFVEDSLKTFKESENSSVKRVPTNSSSQPKAESENSEPTGEEGTEFESVVDDFETTQTEVEELKDPEVSKPEKSEFVISPELDALFMAFDEYAERNMTIEKELWPYYMEIRELEERILGLHGRLTIEERRQHRKQIETLSRRLTSFDERRTELKSEFYENYGVRVDEFGDLYGKMYKDWKKL